MTDNLKIVISISHRRISFDYSKVEGGRGANPYATPDGELKPIPPTKGWMPLAFYVSGTQVTVGEDAQRAARRQAPGAYLDYFKLIRNADITYTLGARTRNVKDLLIDAVEHILRGFYRNVLFKSSADLTNDRATLPLLIVCEDDLTDNEVAFLHRLFLDAGYSEAHVVNYNGYISRYISDSLIKQYDCRKVITLRTEGGHLYLTLFDPAHPDARPVTRAIPDLGSDPRVRLVADSIWRKANASGYLVYEDEIDGIRAIAEELLSSGKSFVTREIPTSLGVCIFEFEIAHYDDAGDDSDSLRLAVEQFLNDHDVSREDRPLLILRGLAVGNPYFKNNMPSRRFGKTIDTDRQLRTEVMKMIISDGSLKDCELEPHHIPEIPESPGSSETHEIPKTPEISEAPATPEPPAKPQPKPEPAPAEPSGKDKRDFRSLQASVKTHVANKRNSEAFAEINDFEARMHAKNVHTFDDDLAKLREPLAKPKDGEHQAHQKNKPSKPKDGEPLAHQQRQPESAPKPRPEPETQLDSDGPVIAAPTARDKTAFREAKVRARDAGKKTAARKILLDFKKSMNDANIFAFDREIAELIDFYTDAKPAADTKPAAAPKPKIPNRRDERQFKLLAIDVDNLLAKGKADEARAQVKTFEQQIHQAGITAFDPEIQNLKEKITNHKK